MCCRERSGRRDAGERACGCRIDALRFLEDGGEVGEIVGGDHVDVGFFLERAPNFSLQVAKYGWIGT